MQEDRVPKMEGLRSGGGGDPHTKALLPPLEFSKNIKLE
jgi:hypothetical protein